jgi:hypothetical protein
VQVALLHADTSSAVDFYDPKPNDPNIGALADRLALHIESLVPRGRANCVDIGYGDTTIAEAIHERLARTNWRCVDVRPTPPGLRHDPLGSEYRVSDDTIPFGDDEFDVAILSDVLHDDPEQAERLLAEAVRVARYVVVRDHFERESFSRSMLRFTRDAFIALANQQRLVIAAFDSGLALQERSPIPRTLVRPDPSFVAVLCRG